ncbi:MAG: sporulation transcription factor Spo0A [Eubacteriales bacterium]|nr:sporulation transcription factor Spo0A [Eubacteriales bacterium]
MDDQISILIADDNNVFCEVLCEYLNRCEDMVVKGVAKDGLEALDMIKELSPEIVVLDLIMPNLDGIGVLERIPDMKLKKMPIFIMLTAIGKDLFIQKAIELGAEYYILKPFDIEILISRIRQIHGEKSAVHDKIPIMSINDERAGEIYQRRLEYIVTDMIKVLGIHPNSIGYHYLREAVVMSMEYNHLHNLIMNLIYCEIADKHHTTTKSVARSIRCIANIAYKNLENLKMKEKDMTIELNTKKKPTNVQLISLLADKARLELKSSILNNRIN